MIEDTKTNAGTRVLPMTDDVYECFKNILKNRPKPKVEPMIGGRMGFLYLDKNDQPMVALHWEKYFQHICEKYNKIYRVQCQRSRLMYAGILITLKRCNTSWDTQILV